MKSHILKIVWTVLAAIIAFGLVADVLTLRDQNELLREQNRLLNVNSRCLGQDLMKAGQKAVELEKICGTAAPGEHDGK